MPDNPSEKLSRFVPGQGWRYDAEHRGDHRMAGHDYTRPGTYLITMVTKDRQRLFGTLRGTTLSPGDPARLEPSPLGRQILEERIPSIHQRCPQMEVWEHCLMPDHLHMIVRIKEQLPEGKNLGQEMWGFKVGCTKAWRAISGQPSVSLFEKGFNDRILMEDGQLDHWKGYIAENAYRKLYRTEHPRFMERALEVHIGGVRYGAFGNLFLLQYPERHQVFFHRRTWEGGIEKPTEETAFWHQQHSRLIALAEQGDVLVTPGISECEKRIKNEALRRHLPLIHLQDTPIRHYWKPEESRYYACAEGTLLILAPWEEDTLPWRESKSALFHHLNELAAVICSPEGVRTLRRGASLE